MLVMDGCILFDGCKILSSLLCFQKIAIVDRKNLEHTRSARQDFGLYILDDICDLTNRTIGFVDYGRSCIDIVAAVSVD